MSVTQKRCHYCEQSAVKAACRKSRDNNIRCSYSKSRKDVTDDLFDDLLKPFGYRLSRYLERFSETEDDYSENSYGEDYP